MLLRQDVLRYDVVEVRWREADRQATEVVSLNLVPEVL